MIAAAPGHPLRVTSGDHCSLQYYHYLNHSSYCFCSGFSTTAVMLITTEETAMGDEPRRRDRSAAPTGAATEAETTAATEQLAGGGVSDTVAPATSCSCGSCQFPARHYFCGPSESSFRRAAQFSPLEAPPRRCLVQQFVRCGYCTGSSHGNKGPLVLRELLSVGALTELSGYLLGNLLTSLVFPFCVSDAKPCCSFLRSSNKCSSRKGNTSACECTVLLCQQRNGFVFIADRLRAQRQGLLLHMQRCEHTKQNQQQQNLTPALVVSQLSRSVRFMLFAEVFWGGRLYHTEEKDGYSCNCCNSCFTCGKPALQKLQQLYATPAVCTSTVGVASVCSRKPTEAETARRAASFPASLNRLLLGGTFSSMLQQLQQVASAVTGEQIQQPIAQRQRFAALLQALQMDAASLDELVAALMLYELLLPTLQQQQQQQVFLLQRLMRLVGNDGWQQLRLCRLALRLISEASLGNICRVLRTSARLPFLLQAAVYRHLDALRAGAIAAVVAAAPLGGHNVSLQRLAALLGCSVSSALQLCLQLPLQRQLPQREQQLGQKGQVATLRFSRCGEINYVFCNRVGNASPVTSDPQLLDLLKFSKAPYGDAWLRTQPPEDTLQVAPHNRTELRELMLHGNCQQLQIQELQSCQLQQRRQPAHPRPGEA